jgi:hypothetical protein
MKIQFIQTGEPNAVQKQKQILCMFKRLPKQKEPMQDYI